jgi:hypothetical protein
MATEPLPIIRPMLTTLRDLPAPPGWGYEFKWDSVRAVASLEAGRIRVVSRPELRTLLERLGRHGLICPQGLKLGLPALHSEMLASPGRCPGLDRSRAARQAGSVHKAHEAFSAAVKADGDGTRTLIDVLLLHRRFPAAR